MFQTIQKTILCSLLACLLVSTSFQAVACVFADYKNVYLFGVNLLSNPQYRNYFYNSPYAEDMCLPGNEKNIAEWQLRYAAAKKTDDFHALIYKADLQTLQKIYAATQGGGKNPLADNEIANLLVANKDQTALAYLVFAKKCESFVVMKFEGWEQEQKEKANPKTIADLLATGQALLDQTTDAFFKQRYAFQLVRLAYYQQPDKQQVVDLFDKIVPTNEKNYIYYRTLLHKAFALKTLNKRSEANLLFAEVFNQSADLRCLAFKNFAIYKNNKFYEGIDEAAWNETIGKQTNADLKAALYLLRASSEYKLNPVFFANSFQTGANIEQLEVFLLRQLKAAESELYLPNLQQTVALDSAKLTFGEIAIDATQVADNQGFFGRIWSAIVNFFKGLFGSKTSNNQNNQTPEVLYGQIYGYQETKDYTKNLTENPDLKTIEETAVAIAEKYPQQATLFYLGAAYCQIMRQKYGLAADNLANAKKTKHNNPAWTSQTLFLETLLAVAKAETIDSETENLVATNSKTLWADLRPDNKTWQRLIIFSELARKYLKQNDLNKAVLAFQYCKQYDVANILLDFYFLPNDLENFATYCKANPSGELDKLFIAELQNANQLKTNWLQDIQATKLARAGLFAEALAKFQVLPADYWQDSTSYYATPYNPQDTTFRPSATAMGTIMDGVGEGVYYSGSFGDECRKIKTSFESSPDNQNTKYEVYENKMKFLEKLVALQQKATNSKENEAAQFYMQMANGMSHTPFWLYNNSLWGCGGMLDAMRHSNPAGYPFNVSTTFATEFHNRKMHVVRSYCVPYLASEYYKKAKETATDKELQAQALFGQSAALHHPLASHWESGIQLNAKATLKQLISDYANSPYAQMAHGCMGSY